MMAVIVLIISLVMLLILGKEEIHPSWYLPKNWVNIKKTSIGYGLIWQPKKQGLLFLLISMGLLWLSDQFYLPMLNTAVLMTICWVSIPIVWIWQAQFQYHALEFEQITTFLQHFIAYFKSSEKVLLSLSESVAYVEGQLKEVVEKAIEHLKQTGDTSAAFNIITDRYPHFIVNNCQIWVATAEQFGFEQSKEAIELLEDDIDDWIEDTMLFIRNRLQMKNRILLMCGMSAVIALFNQNLLSSFLDLHEVAIYHHVIMLFLLSLHITTLMAFRLIKGRWIAKGECLR
jgi:Flp pilus assembly protein TadB